MSKFIKLVALLSVALCATGAWGSQNRRVFTQAVPVEFEVALLPQDAKGNEYFIRFFGESMPVSEAFVLACTAYTAQRDFFAASTQDNAMLLKKPGFKKFTWDVSTLLAPLEVEFEKHFNIDEKLIQSKDVRRALIIKPVLELIQDLGTIISRGEQDTTERLFLRAKLVDLMGNQDAFRQCSALLMDRLLGAVPPMRTFRGHEGLVTGALLLPNNQILSWSMDTTLRLWDLGTQGADVRPMRTFRGHESYVTGALLLPDNRVLSWSADGTLRLWDLSTQGADVPPMRTFRGHGGNQVYGALLLPNNQALSWASDDALIVWDLNAQGDMVFPLRTFEKQGKDVRGALLSPDNQVLLGFGDGTVRLWVNGTQGAIVGQVSPPEGHGKNVRDALVLPNNHVLSWSGERMRLWDPNMFTNLTMLELDLCVRMLTSERLFDLSEDRETFAQLPVELQQALIEKMLTNVTKAKELIHLTPEQFALCRRILLSDQVVQIQDGSKDYEVFMLLPENVKALFLEKKVTMLKSEELD